MIRVDNDYVINVDNRQYTACFDPHKTSIDKKTGKEIPVYKELGYYRKLQNAIKRILEHKAKNGLISDTYSLSEALTKLQGIYNEFEDILERAINEDCK